MLDCSRMGRLFFAAAVVGSTASAWGQAVLVASSFDVDAEGWIARDFTGLCSTLVPQGGVSGSYVSTGGLAGGYFAYREPALVGIEPYFRAGPSFSGDFSSAYGGFLKFDRRMLQNAGWFSVQDVHLQGAVSGEVVTLIGDSRGRPQRWWRVNWIPLVEGAWKVGSCDGPYATELQVRDVLANLTSVFVKAEYRSGVEDHHIDNVVILGPPTGPVSTFELDTDGWTIAGDAAISWYDSPGDAPQCIQGVDAASGIGYDFVAPAKFQGDQSGAIGRTMELDFWASPGSSTFADGGAPGFLRIFGENGEILRYYNANLPITGGIWRHHSIPLRPSPAWTRQSDQGLATLEDFEQVFGSITKLAIRGEYRSGGETERLDNVVFGINTPSVVVSVDGGFVSSACSNTSLQIESVVGGEGPFTYQWRVESPEGSGIFVDLVDGIYREEISGFEFGVTGSAEETLEVSGFMRGTRSNNVRLAVIVSNAGGSVRSNRLAIDLDCCPADLTGDFVLDILDVFAFLDAYNTLDSAADITGDGIIDISDVFAFLGSYSAGCS